MNPMRKRVLALWITVGLIAFQRVDAGVNGDQVVLVGPGSGQRSMVKGIAIDLGSGDDMVVLDFRAYPRRFMGGVRVAAGDVNGDGIADIITGAGPGVASSLVRVFDGDTGDLLRQFLAYRPSFRGGIFVAAGDVNNDGKADIVVGPGAGAPPEVRVIDGASNTLLHSFLAYNSSFRGGVRVATGMSTMMASLTLLPAQVPAPHRL